MAAIADVLALEKLEEDFFRGPIIESTFQRTFGGQVAAQALEAATQTVSGVEPRLAVHSLHSYFLRGGDLTVPVVFHVDRVRDGRSFATRRVEAVQHGRTIFTLGASFSRRGDEGIEHQDTMPDVPGPEQLSSAVARGAMSADFLEEWKQWDIRPVPQDAVRRDPGRAAQQRVWFRNRDRLPDDETFHVCTLTYMSDMTLLSAAAVPHPGVRTQDASLDHALWFLRPFRADEWLLYDQTSPSAAMGRALTMGRIFTERGTLVAYVVQEGLSRLLRDDTLERYPGERAQRREASSDPRKESTS